MDHTAVLTRSAAPPDAVVRYADHADAVVDLHLPPRRVGAPIPVAHLVVLLHGGFWRAAYDRRHTRPLAEALAREGLVVATPEYRRVGAEGRQAGGWPRTFEDVRAAVEALPDLLEELDVAVDRATVTGHSAGGHLALWLASEDDVVARLPAGRVVALAPVGDLRAGAAAGLGRGAVGALLGGKPAELPQRYDAADPATRFARRPDLEVVVLHGVDDDEVPVGNSRGLVAAHPWVRLVELPGIEHYGLIDPLSPAWPTVLANITGTGRS